MSEFHDRLARLRCAIDDNRDKIFSAAAAHVDQEQYVALFFQAIGRNPRILDCTLPSQILSLTDSAVLGLPINSIEGDGYLVPRQRSIKDRNGNWTKLWELQFQAGYRGKLKLAYESPLIAGITVELVRDGDAFSASLGTDQEIHHNPRGSGPVTHCYAVVWLTSGARRCVVWSKEQIDEHKAAYAQGTDKKTSAWQTAWKTMARKTVLLDLLKFAPVSDRARRVMQAEEYADAGVRTNGLKSGDTLPADELDAAIVDDADGDGWPSPEEVAADEARLQANGTVGE